MNMNALSIGNLAQGLMLRSRSSALKNDIQTLTLELSSGRTADISKKLGGDFSILADIENRLTQVAGYAAGTQETAHFAEAMQINLGALGALSLDLGNDLVSTMPSNLAGQRAHMSGVAQEQLTHAITLINGSAAGRSLFAGMATDGAAVADSQTLLSALRTEVTGLTAASDIEAAIDAWFAAPAGYRDTMYQGAAQNLGPMRISETERVTLSLNADGEDFRQVLRNLAVAALASDPALTLDGDTQNALLSSAGYGLLSAQDSLTQTRAELGFAQARIDEVATRNAASRLSLEYAQSGLLDADPFETATRLEEVQFQLESLYAVTVRSSQLSLLRFMT
jgi:flagellar hook-associated protein 3 FlgL